MKLLPTVELPMGQSSFAGDMMTVSLIQVLLKLKGVLQIQELHRAIGYFTVKLYCGNLRILCVLLSITFVCTPYLKRGGRKCFKRAEFIPTLINIQVYM